MSVKHTRAAEFTAGPLVIVRCLTGEEVANFKRKQGAEFFVAAPDMYDALESARETLEIEIEALQQSDHSDANASWPMLHNALVEIEEALAKARGEDA